VEVAVGVSVAVIAAIVAALFLLRKAGVDVFKACRKGKEESHILDLAESQSSTYVDP
jgi:uncharacterized membrane protein